VGNNLAAALLRLGRAGEARAVLQKALRNAPDDRDLLLNLRLAKSMMDRK